MAEALERITNLLALLLESRVPLTLEQIANELHGQYPSGTVALRGAFERDKTVLRDVGVPLDTTVLSGQQAGRTAYSVDRERYELRGLALTDEERHALQVAVAASRLGNAEFGLFKLGGVPDAGAPVSAHLPEIDELPVLREALAERAEVAFSYRGTARRLQPYGLLLRGGHWYLIGHDLAAAGQRTYRVDRIEGAVDVGEPGTFQRPEDFSAAAAFPADPKELGDEPTSRADVRFDAPLASLITGSLPDEAVVRREPDGSVVVSVACANLDAFRAWLFAWGTHAEVLGPAQVRAAVVAWLDDLAGTTPGAAAVTAPQGRGSS